MAGCGLIGVALSNSGMPIDIGLAAPEFGEMAPNVPLHATKLVIERIAMPR